MHTLVAQCSSSGKSECSAPNARALSVTPDNHNKIKVNLFSCYEWLNYD